MTPLMKNQYNGFKLNGSLATRIKFEAFIRISEIQDRKRKNFEGDEIPYWIVIDEFGAKFGVFNEAVWRQIITGERYYVSGQVKIGKGGTFLNIDNVRPLTEIAEAGQEGRSQYLADTGTEEEKNTKTRPETASNVMELEIGVCHECRKNFPKTDLIYVGEALEIIPSGASSAFFLCPECHAAHQRILDSLSLVPGEVS